MEWTMLAGLAEEDRRRILSSARRRRFGRNEIVFHEGDPGDTVHLLAKGKVGVRVTTPLGDTAMLAVLGPGASFGELALVSDRDVRTATVVALEAVETLSLHRRDFMQLREDHPTVERLLVAALAQQVRRLSTQLIEAHFVPVERRVVRRLLDLAEIYGHGDGEVVVPLTQEELASLAGTTRPTVNRVLRELEGQSVLSIGRGRLAILDRDALARRAR